MHIVQTIDESTETNEMIVKNDDVNQKIQADIIIEIKNASNDDIYNERNN